MLRSLYTSESGMINYAGQVDTISNNIANIHTSGFKKSRRDFQELVTGKMKKTSGVMTASVQKNFSQGPLQETGDPLHLAITGEGFFVLRDAEGRNRYSRDGNFHLDADGNLVHQSGFLLDREVRVPNGVTRIQFSPDGRVFGETQKGKPPIDIGEIELALFSNPSGLEAVGGNLYRESANSGKASIDRPGEDGHGKIQPGMLEDSNVVLVKELVSLLTAERTFELNSKALQTSNQMIQTALNL